MTALKSLMQRARTLVRDHVGRHLDRGRSRRVVLFALPLVAAFATVLVAIASSAAEPDGPDAGEVDRAALASVQAYAEGMSAWWSIVLDGSGFIDHARLRTPGDADTLPRVRPVAELEPMHDAIEANLAAVLQTRLTARDAGLLLGIAAGYCDPKRYRDEGITFAPEIRGLQLWNRDGGDCISSARWDPEGENYVVACGEDATLRSWGVAFGVDTSELLTACASQRLATQAWVDIQHAWVRSLLTSCGLPASDEGLAPDEAIALCLGQ